MARFAPLLLRLEPAASLAAAYTFYCLAEARVDFGGVCVGTTGSCLHVWKRSRPEAAWRILTRPEIIRRHGHPVNADGNQGAHRPPTPVSSGFSAVGLHIFPIVFPAVSVFASRRLVTSTPPHSPSRFTGNIAGRKVAIRERRSQRSRRTFFTSSQLR